MNLEQLKQAYLRQRNDWARTAKRVEHLLEPHEYLVTYVAWLEHKAIQGNPRLAKRAYEAALAYLSKEMGRGEFQTEESS